LVKSEKNRIYSKSELRPSSDSRPPNILHEPRMIVIRENTCINTLVQNGKLDILSKQFPEIIIPETIMPANNPDPAKQEYLQKKITPD